MTKGAIRPDVRMRFREIVRRGIERADREQAEELAKIRPYRRRSWTDRRTGREALELER
jgi:hypothetical protein